jgi:hypothetical protein
MPDHDVASPCAFETGAVVSGGAQDARTTSTHGEVDLRVLWAI